MTKYWDDNIGEKDWEEVKWNKKKETNKKVEKKIITLGQKIVLLRSRANLTAKQLASRMNVKISLILDYETNRIMPNKSHLSKLSKILGENLINYSC